MGRHNLQHLGVTMIEETLQDNKKKLAEAVENAQKELTDLEASKSTILDALNAARAVLELKQGAKTAAQSAFLDAKAATKTAEESLAEAVESQKQGDASFAALETEKAAIDAAYQEHFKTPMDANEGPHHSFLKPFIETLGLEDSLTSALPSSCVKPKEQRGGFDDLVLTELGKALVSKIESLDKNIAEAASVATERKVAVTSAEAVLESKKAADSAAAADFESATAVHSEAEAEVTKASAEWTAFEPQVQEATQKHNVHDTLRIDFDQTVLKNFATLRDKEVIVAMEEEAAVAGA